MRVELQGIAVHAAGREILHNINLQIEPGEVLAIAGPSGSGKTTLLNVIGLLQQVSDGAVLIDGVNTLKWLTGNAPNSGMTGQALFSKTMA